MTLAAAGDSSAAEEILDDVIRRTGGLDASALDRADALALQASLRDIGGGTADGEPPP